MDETVNSNLEPEKGKNLAEQTPAADAPAVEAPKAAPKKRAAKK